MHTLLDLHGSIPTFTALQKRKRTTSIFILDQFTPEAGSYYVMDRGYVDFERRIVATTSDLKTKDLALGMGRYAARLS